MPLQYVDPHRQRGPLYKANVRFGRSRAGQYIARHLAPKIDPWLHRISGGRANMGLVINAPLTTTGAKSGLPRVTQLTYFHDGPDPIVMASNYGGRTHPQWYYNLKANPECDFGGDPFVATEVTDPGEYARLYGLAERVYAGYGDYKTTSTSAGRAIPVFRLRTR